MWGENMAEKGEIRNRLAGILIDNGKILFIKHRKNNMEYWLLPGGGLEYGESFQKCLKREFEEETGLIIDVQNMKFISESIEPNHNRHIVNIYFMVSAKDLELNLGDEENLIDLKFMGKDEIVQNTIYPNIKKELVELLAGDNKKLEYLGNRWD